MIALLVLPGFIFGKLKIFPDTMAKSLSSMVINLCLPAVIIEALQVNYSTSLALNIALCVIMWAVIVIISFGISMLLKKAMNLSKIETALVICMFSVPNTGFIGIPLLTALFGESALFYSSVCEIANDIFSYTIVLTLIMLSTGYTTKFSFKDFFNPPIISIIIGFFLFISGIRLPQVLSTPIGYMADCMTPLAMFIIGLQLSQMRLSEFIGDKRIYIICAIRLLFFPTAAFIILRIILGINDMFTTVFILMMGMPAGAFCAIFAENFNSDVNFATKGVMLSDILCLITLPIFTMLL